MKKIIFLIILLTTFGLSVFAQNDKCVQSGWVEDKDPNGTNVRDAPGLNGKVIAVIPHAKEPGEEGMFDAIGYSNGWLKITVVENVDGVVYFKGIGWISAKKVSFAIQSKSTSRLVPLYALPKRSSKKIGVVHEDDKFEIVGFDCFGYKINSKGKTGWIWREDYCGNVVTTCV